MATRMLIDATHAEETRVVVVKGNRLEEFDFETSTKRPLKGNIYLAKVIRVEPSLQAAFVDYGGNRHGFLAFSEIHPDYYQIPIADRQALLERQAAEEAAAEAAAEAEDAAAEAAEAERSAAGDRSPDAIGAATEIEEIGGRIAGDPATQAEPPANVEDFPGYANGLPETAMAETTGAGSDTIAAAPAVEDWPPAADEAAQPTMDGGQPIGELAGAENEGEEEQANEASANARRGRSDITSIGGDVLDEVAPRRFGPTRAYKIQEVIKRRQIMLVQVVKEERGNKGAALTSFLSLAGRYCVLMPNTARGGGISRKIVSPADRKRLKNIVGELEVPEGMGVILRTAGLDRSKAEIKRDFEYLVRLWDSVRELTLKSTAPCLVYEEGSLIKRAIRDYYSGEIEEIMVEGEEAYRVAKDFMRMLMPSHAKRVQPYRERVHLFHRYQVEQQFDSMYSPTVQLRSGGYIVINPTEALVSIDVNSGKSTREHNIEETAYKTNLEASEEIARQLRLRDLAGLIVIDFIDMQDSRNNRNVERRLKESLKSDRARIQVGRISAFGLLEMSRQRLRPSLLESSTELCVHCQGRGYVRSTESTVLHVLRAIEDEGMRDRSSEITVSLMTSAAIYLLNQKREAIRDIESRYQMRIIVLGDDTLVPPAYRIDRQKTRTPSPEAARPIHAAIHTESVMPEEAEVEEEVEAEVEETVAAAPQVTNGGAAEDGSRKRRRRRRRRRGGKDGDAMAGGAPGGELPGAAEGEFAVAEADEPQSAEAQPGEAEPAGAEDESGQRRRRRGRRGGRRRGRDEGHLNGAEESTGIPLDIPPASVIDAESPAAEFIPARPPESQSQSDLSLPGHRTEDLPAAVEYVEAARPQPVAVAAEPIPEPAAEIAPKPEPAVIEPPATEPAAAAPAAPPRRGWWRRRE